MKGDPGKGTRWGVTQATYDRWRAFKGLAKRSVAHCSQAEAHEIFWRWYWLIPRCDLLKLPADLAYFDTAVMISQPVELLQSVLGVDTDGWFGPATFAAAQARMPAELARDVLIARLGYHIRENNEKFEPGWVNRARTLLREVAA